MSFLDCRDKVKDYIAASIPSLDVEALLVPRTDFSEIVDMAVFVIPFEKTIVRESRKLSGKIYTIQVGVIQKVNKAETGKSGDEILARVEDEIEVLFLNQNLPAAGPTVYYQLSSPKVIPFYDYQYLDDDKVIVSVIQIEYKEFVEVT